MNTTAVFDKTITAWTASPRPRYISSRGGTRSGKTFSILQLLYLQAVKEEQRGDPPMVTSIVSESMPHLKRGAIRDFKTILTSERLWIEDRWSETDKAYTFANGSIIEFFSVDNAGKVFGSARDRLFVNEAQHIDYETFRQLAVRTRERIVIDYNPTHEFWAMTEIEPRSNCVLIHSTYRDNGYLTPEQVAEIESNRHATNWWRVFGEGEVGSLDGLVYAFDIVDGIPADLGDKWTEVHGLDFGFTNDPTARVCVVADPRRKEAYVDQRCYRTGMRNRDIVADMRRDLRPGIPVYADCAEPKSIAEIADEGFSVRPCNKGGGGRGSALLFQLQWMAGWTLHFTKASVDLIHEGRNYCWEKDQSGKPTNTPIDKYNHALDAMRYALYTHFAQRAGMGTYNVTNPRISTLNRIRNNERHRHH